MGVRLHLTLTILCCVATVVAGGLYWLCFAPKNFLILFLLPIAVCIVEQVFERLIPVRCPECGKRLSCRILSRPHHHHDRMTRETINRTGESRVSTYECLHCPYRFPQHVPDNWR